ncbi:hypothetical protein TNCV_839711 [Trichonephila clavipes]|nr:hypothetical protein TNCV_839711 [Trichonephila clavipes]
MSSNPCTTEDPSCRGADVRYICRGSKSSRWFGVIVWREVCQLSGLIENETKSPLGPRSRSRAYDLRCSRPLWSLKVPWNTVFRPLIYIIYLTDYVPFGSDVHLYWGAVLAQKFPIWLKHKTHSAIPCGSLEREHTSPVLKAQESDYREGVEDDKRSGCPQIGFNQIGFCGGTVCLHIVTRMLNEDQFADQVKSASQAELKDMAKMDSRNISMTFTSHGKNSVRELLNPTTYINKVHCQGWIFSVREIMLPFIHLAFSPDGPKIMTETLLCLVDLHDLTISESN